MKADYDTILYIIISIVIFVISSLGRGKKKAPISNAPVNPENNPFNTEKSIDDYDFISNFEEIFSPVKKEIKIEAPVIKQETKVEKNTVEVVEPQTIQSILESKELFDEAEYHILADFDIKKAVVYSEILNRKYF